MGKINLSKKKKEEIQKFLIERFTILKDLRQELDDVVKDEVKLYNNEDWKQTDQQKGMHEEKKNIPYLYSIVQTMVARIKDAFFGTDNYLKIFVENKKFKQYEKDIQKWCQAELDKSKLKYKSRDFLEGSITERISWLHPRPVYKKNGRGIEKVDIDVYSFFDVWFDTTAKTIDDTDFFVKKPVKLWTILENTDNYFNQDEVKKSSPPDDLIDAKEREIHDAKYEDKISYYEKSGNPTIDKVELLEWYGLYNMGTEEKPDYKEMIFTLANRTVLCRAEINDIKTKKKRLFFPIRCLAQGKSLLGKSVQQLVKDQQQDLNEIAALRMKNFKTLIKLLFKYKRSAGIRFEELFADGGNAVGFDDDFNDVTTFDVPNLVREATLMMQEKRNTIQEITGATDPMMGTSPAGTTTATEISKLTEQAMFRFSMMADNVYLDLVECINFIVILLISNNLKDIIIDNAALADFVKQDIEDIEDSVNIDISLNQLAMRREVERSQFIQAMNVLLGSVDKFGGNARLLMKMFMERLGMENVDEIMKPPPEDQQLIDSILPILKANPQLIMLITQLAAGQGSLPEEQLRGGSPLAVPGATSQATPEETVYNQNPEGTRGL